MPVERMYEELAPYYDRIHAWRDDERHSRQVAEVLEAHARRPVESLLDVACGTGEHVRHLAERYLCMGLDRSRAMLEVARGKVPQARFVQADMTNFALADEFDAVTCLFSSIAYLQTEQRLEAALACMAEHLAPEGVVVLEPWFTPEDGRSGEHVLQTYEGEDVVVARMGTSSVDGDTTTVTMHWLLGENGDVRHVVEEHELVRFSRVTLLAAFEAAGLDGEFVAAGDRGRRGLYVATRPA